MNILLCMLGELISNDKMKDRFELIIESSAEDIRVRKTLVMLLGTWSARFKGEQGIYTLQQLHERGLSLFHSGKVSFIFYINR